MAVIFHLPTLTLKNPLAIFIVKIKKKISTQSCLQLNVGFIFKFINYLGFRNKSTPQFSMFYNVTHRYKRLQRLNIIFLNIIPRTNKLPKIRFISESISIYSNF